MVLCSRNFVTISLLGIPIFLGLVSSPFLLVQNVHADTVQTSVTVIGITFTIDPSNIDLGSVTPGLPVTAVNTLTVSTSNASGFTIKVKRNDTDTTLDLDSDSSTNISDRTVWNPSANSGNGNATAWSSSDRHLGFRIQQTGTDTDNYNSTWWGSNDTNAEFAGFPALSQTIVNRTTNPLGSTDTVIVYKLDIPGTQPTGVYSGGITYSAIVNL